MLLFILCTLCCVIGAESVLHAAGYAGGEATFFCPYAEGYNYHIKYLCNAKCMNDDDVLIETGQGQNGRYSIYDDTQKRVFTVTIAELDHTDAGTYWCGVTKTGRDAYTEAMLDVLPDRCCDTVTEIQGKTEGSVSISCTYGDEYQNNLKYICRGRQPSICLSQAVVTSDQRQNGKFRLNDNQFSRQFRVTITRLTQLDSGSYLCGVHTNTGLDHFSLVQLKVEEWCCVNLNKLTGTVGRPLQMHCPYPPQHRGNPKFLCKGDGRYTCNKIVTSQGSNHRFTLQEGSSSFSVTITELRADDNGIYWCGSDTEWSAGNYVKIQLSVVFPPPTSAYFTVSPQISVKPEAEYVRPVIFTAGAVVAVLMILIGIFIMSYHKAQKAKVNADSNEMKTAAESGEEVMDFDDIYENKEVVARALHHDDKADGDQECLYQNISMENIYSNETVSIANKPNKKRKV